MTPARLAEFRRTGLLEGRFVGHFASEIAVRVEEVSLTNSDS